MNYQNKVYGQNIQGAKMVIDDMIIEQVTDFIYPKKHDLQNQNRQYNKNTPV